MIFALIPILFLADIKALNVDDQGHDISEIPCFFGQLRLVLRMPYTT